MDIMQFTDVEMSIKVRGEVLQVFLSILDWALNIEYDETKDFSEIN